MRKYWAPLAGALLAVTAIGNTETAAAQSAAATPTDPAKLGEATAIIEIMFPPAEREQTFDTMINELLAQFRKGVPVNLVSDPGLKAIVDKYFDSIPVRVKPAIQAHLPRIMQATAVAYTHEFSLEELKQIHAFAQTDVGEHYLKRASALIGDPVVAEENSAYMKDIQAASASMQSDMRQELTAYLTAHPAVAEKILKDSKAN
jgi:hypothetical protein